MKAVLNVGGNSKAIPIPSYYAGWRHDLLDIDPTGGPDVVCDARELSTLAASGYDAVYCSHNLEHYFAHDVPKVLAGFHYVLKTDGFAEIRVPDLDAVLRLYVERNLDIGDVLYQAQAGPITVRDVLYGYGKQIERSGNDFFAHKTGFTLKSLTRYLAEAGFKHVASRTGQSLEILAYAFKVEPTSDQRILLGLT